MANKKNEAEFAVAKNGQVLNIVYDAQDYEGVRMAIESLRLDFKAVTGNVPQTDMPMQEQCIIIGSLQSCFIRQMLKAGKLQKKEIEGKREKYLLQIVDKPLDGVSQALVIMHLRAANTPCASVRWTMLWCYRRFLSIWEVCIRATSVIRKH